MLVMNSPGKAVIPVHFRFRFAEDITITCLRRHTDVVQLTYTRA